MGRWGKGIFDSDSVMDYVDTIEARIKREIVYWMAPEQVGENGWWLAQVLAVVEMIILFEQRRIGFGGVIIQSEKLVQRWRETLMPIWDGDWKADTNYPIELDNYTYRQAHRPVIEAIFDHLQSIAHFWETDLATRPELPSILLNYSLPYFSIRRTKTDNEAWVEPFIKDLKDQLVKDIIYWLSPDMRIEVIVDSVADEEVPAAAELLTFICEEYQQRVGVTGETVRRWCDTALQRIREYAEDKTITWENGDERLKIIKATFDKLEAVALKYPPDPLYDLDIPTL